MYERIFHQNTITNYIPVLHNVDGLDSTLLAKLDHSHTHRGGSIVLDEEIAGVQLGKVSKQSVGNTSAVQHSGSNLHRDALRGGNDVILRNNDTLGPSS